MAKIMCEIEEAPWAKLHIPNGVFDNSLAYEEILKKQNVIANMHSCAMAEKKEQEHISFAFALDELDNLIKVDPETGMKIDGNLPPFPPVLNSAQPGAWWVDICGRRKKLTKENIEKLGVLSCQSCGGMFVSKGDKGNTTLRVRSAYKATTIARGARRLCFPCIRREIFSNIHKFNDSIFLAADKDKEFLRGFGRTVGIEIECNPSLMSVVRAIESKFANIKSDHSLRGSGVEFTSPILRESNCEAWLRRFRETVRGRVYSRCGLHIWLGAPDFSWADFIKVWKYCKMWEPEFFSMVSRSRRPKDSDDKSGRPIRLPDPFLYRIKNKSELLYVLYGRDGKGKTLWNPDVGNSMMVADKRANDQNGTHYNGIIHRYHWINLQGFWHRRAFEIRLHQGTTNTRKIAMWIRLWSDVFDHISRGGSLNIPPLSVTSSLVRRYYENRISQLSRL